MNKPNTRCRVCGKEYFCCSDSKKIGSWRTMACSIECFQEYMNRIEKSRTCNEENKATQENSTTEKIKTRKKKLVYSDINTENNNIIED